jgi:cytochrome bd-type quinol oxidase subunit 2
MNPFTILAYVVMAGVLVVLARGVWTLYKTSDEARSRSNRLMRLRVALQFVAVILLMAGLWWKNHS